MVCFDCWRVCVTMKSCLCSKISFFRACAIDYLKFKQGYRIVNNFAIILKMQDETPFTQIPFKELSILSFPGNTVSKLCLEGIKSLKNIMQKVINPCNFYFKYLISNTETIKRLLKVEALIICWKKQTHTELFSSGQVIVQGS